MSMIQAEQKVDWEPQLPSIKPEKDELQNSHPSGRKGGSHNFIEEEDIVTCRSWVKASLNAAKSTDRTSNMFFGDVHALYIKDKPSNTPERNVDSIKRRFSKVLSPAVSKFVGHLSRSMALKRSGWNEAQYIAEAKRAYANTEKTTFVFEASWNELKSIPKFEIPATAANIPIMERLGLLKCETQMNDELSSSSADDLSITTNPKKRAGATRPDAGKKMTKAENQRKAISNVALDEATKRTETLAAIAEEKNKLIKTQNDVMTQQNNDAIMAVLDPTDPDAIEYHSFRKGEILQAMRSSRNQP